MRETGPIPEDRHWRRSGDELLEQLESLPGQFYRLKTQPREVAAWMSEALDVPLAHRVAGARHDDGDRRGRLLERGQHGSGGDDDVNLQTGQLGGQTGQAIWPAFAPAWLGHEMLSIHVAELAQSAQKRVGLWAPGLGPGQVRGCLTSAEDPDPIDLARRLGLGGA